MADIARADLERSLLQARIFGLHAARLDLRQYSDYNTAVLDELFGRLGWIEGFGEMDGPDRAAALSDALARPVPDLTNFDELSPQAAETLNLFATVKRAVDYYGPELFGPYVVSMTHGPEDILTGGFADPGIVVQHQGIRAQGNAALAGNVADGGAFRDVLLSFVLLACLHC